MAADRPSTRRCRRDARGAADAAGLRDTVTELIRRAQARASVRPDFGIEDIPMFIVQPRRGGPDGGRRRARWERHLELMLDGLRPRAAV
jgi:hypothetical protein